MRFINDPKTMDLSIITVSWNVKDRLRESLRAIFESVGAAAGGQAGANLSPGQKPMTFEVFVVDNASEDGTAEMVREEFPQVRLIANEKNRGFAAANNQAIRSASGEFILLLNPDMRVFPDTLPNMVKWLRGHTDVGVAGLRLVNEKGELLPHVRRFPGFWDQAALILKIPHIFPRVLARYLALDFDYDKEAEVDSIRGSFFMIRRDAMFDGLSRSADSPPAIGILDERFFIWFEEVDFCRRLWIAGWRVLYTPEAKCVDYVGQSFKQVPSLKKQKMFTESMVKYFWKHEPWWEALGITLLRPVGIFLMWMREKFFEYK